MANKIYIEPPESERKYRRLVALGKELGVPVPQVFLEMEVKMPDGRVVHHHRQRSHSWCRNAYNHLFSELAAVDGSDNTYAAGKVSTKSTAGVVCFGAGAIAQQNGFPMGTAGWGYTAAAGDVTLGIVVGSNVGAENFEDFVLLTPIANGTGAGQLTYVASQVYVVSYVAGTKTLSATLVRFMNNNTVGMTDVTVREVALVNGALYTGAGAGKLGMQSRDHVADIVIPATGQLKVTYVISLVYPA